MNIFPTIAKTRYQLLQSYPFSEAATGGVLQKKVFLEISQNSQENTCASVSFLIKLQISGLQLYWKKRLWHRWFSVNFTKFLRTPFLQNTSGQLLLHLKCLLMSWLRLRILSLVHKLDNPYNDPIESDLLMYFVLYHSDDFISL